MTRWIEILLLIAMGSGRSFADAAIAGAMPSPKPTGAWLRNQEPGWQDQFDFDGDGRPDRVGYTYSGGGHCCYRFSVTLSTSGRTTRFPFDVDGGYVAGVDFSRPDHFCVATDTAKRAVMRMEIAT